MRAAAIDSVVQQMPTTFYTPDFEVAVIKHSKNIYIKGYGVRSLTTMLNLQRFINDQEILFSTAIYYDHL